MNNLYCLLIGILITLMTTFNGILSENIGNYTSTVIVHLVGLLSTIFVMLFSKRKIIFNKNIPLYLYSAGAIGVLTVLFNNISFNAVGISLTLSLGLLGQSLTSMIIDHYGLLGMKINKFNKKKILGFALMTIGIIIMTIY
ncbi:DMT family transporter [Clostridium ihumii]|uniref:DMT family transporter n=1 Tax=Clostridium ihumii TaxID=1470356 RepID=UPI00058D2B06|nr:DMT family transporter [Clostridium ihumii]